jgi:splicing factor 1
MLKPNTFVPPNDYRPLKKEKRIFLPEDDPDVNYIGIILGPRGSTQKILENKSGCRISIRGRGTKQNKFNSDEKMHVFL